MSSTFRIEEGEKYAFVGIPVGRIASSVPEALEIKDGMWVVRSCPVGIPAHWKEWLGTLTANHILDAKLYLLVKAAASEPEILDGENKKLLDLLRRWYWGMLITVPYMTHDRTAALTGAQGDATTEVRQVQQWEQVVRVSGAPFPEVRLSHLQEAVEVAEAIEDLQGDRYSRVWRLVHAFWNGLIDDDFGNKVHQFVRTVEGFLLPEVGKTKKQFVSRTELFIGRGYDSVAREAFDIRSRVEHLNGAFSSPPGPARFTEALVILQRAMEMEAVARYCLRRFFTTPRIWPHFEDDGKLKDFWTMSLDDRENIWGEPMDLPAVSSAFQGKYLEPEDIGL